MQKNNYNSIAKIYDNLSQLFFGSTLLDAQLTFIQQLPTKGEILFIGGGSGKLLLKIIELYPPLKITYLDHSSKMIALSKKAIKGKTHQITFIVGNESKLENNKQFDAIISFFIFDLYLKRNQQELFKQLNIHLKLNGQWFFADFSKPKNSKQKAIEIVMFFFFRIFTNIESRKLMNFRYLFDNSQFQLKKEQIFKQGFIESMVFQKIKE